MKRFFILITFIILIMCTSAFAADNAIDKGSKIIGVTGYLMHQSGELYESNGKASLITYIAPNFSFFTSKGVYLGPEILFQTQSSYNFEVSQFGVGPRIGFILNPAAAEKNNKQFSLYYFSLFAMFSRLTTTQTSYYYNYYPQPYTIKLESNNLTFGVQVGTYNMIQSHFALDFNLRLFVDKNNVINSKHYDETGFTVMFGLGLVGFSF